jgi:hypothetical protein
MTRRNSWIPLCVIWYIISFLVLQQLRSRKCQPQGWRKCTQLIKPYSPRWMLPFVAPRWDCSHQDGSIFVQGSAHRCYFSSRYDNVFTLQEMSVIYGFSNCWRHSEFLATDREARVRFPALPGEKNIVGLERGALSLVSTTEELLDRKSSGSCLENREYGSRDPSCWPRGTFYPQKLAITSPTSGGRSVGVVRLRTQTMEFVCLFVVCKTEITSLK